MQTLPGSPTLSTPSAAMGRQFNPMATSPDFTIAPPWRRPKLPGWMPPSPPTWINRGWGDLDGNTGTRLGQDLWTIGVAGRGCAVCFNLLGATLWSGADHARGTQGSGRQAGPVGGESPGLQVPSPYPPASAFADHFCQNMSDKIGCCSLMSNKAGVGDRLDAETDARTRGG